MHTHTVKQYKVSIILPVYNGINFLNRTVNSIINQSLGFENIELIIIDDCSTDGSLEFCESLSEKYCNVKFFVNKKNHGTAGYSRNLGISVATGEYFTFIDQDDSIPYNSLEILLTNIQKLNSIYDDVNLLIADYNIISQGEIITDFNNSIYINFTQNNYIWEVKPELFFAGQFATCWSNIYKTKYYQKHKKIRFPTKCLNEDLYFMLKYNVKPNNVAYTNIPVYEYNIHEKSLLQNLNSENILLQLKGFLKIYKLLKINNKKEIGAKFYHDSIKNLRKTIYENIDKINNKEFNIIIKLLNKYDLEKVQ